MKPNLHALIIEDSVDDTQLLVRELEHGGYAVTHERVETAAALKTALARETWDIVFCDYTLPQFNGQSALRIAKETGRDQPFIYVSGTIGEDIAVEAMKAGAHDYVMKGNLTRLASAVERELREAVVRREHRELEADRERLVAELQAALADVKTLAGLLPICSWCKQIRDDHGHWQQIEKYIQEHSQAGFTHSVCPDCVRHLHGEGAADDKLRN